MKRVQVRVRTHLSLVLSTLLALLVIWREWTELRKAAELLSPSQWLLAVLLIATMPLLVRFRWITVIRQRVGWGEWAVVGTIVLADILFGITQGAGLIKAIAAVTPSDRVDLLVLIITLGTLGAALWEILGDKLSSSPRDAWFAYQVRRLLALLDAFYVPETEESIAPAADVLERFTQEVIEAACTTLCGKTTVAGGYLKPSKGLLKLWKQSNGAEYDEELEIPLRSTEPGPGPAALAFKQKIRPYHSVYLPEKDRPEAWFVATAGAGYRLPPPQQVGWVAARDKALEDFKSVVCIPVRFYAGGGKEYNMGALTFSTKARDPFLPRDFLMAESFARILAQALSIAQDADQKRNADK